MEKFADFLAKIDDPDHLERMEEVLTWVLTQFPNLKPKMAWNQPMFTDHDTFIIGFSISKQHMAVAPERVVIDQYSKEIVEAGYDHTKELVRIKWKHEVDYSLLEKLIAFNILDKEDCTTFWRQ
jgi:uncharacterized protein